MLQIGFPSRCGGTDDCGIFHLLIVTEELARGGISPLVIEADTPGPARTSLDKMGWRCSDTATLCFDNGRVPFANRIGAGNQGFGVIMFNFNRERLMLAAQAWATAQVCHEQVLVYTQKRLS